MIFRYITKKSNIFSQTILNFIMKTLRNFFLILAMINSLDASSQPYSVMVSNFTSNSCLWNCQLINNDPVVFGDYAKQLSNSGYTFETFDQSLTSLPMSRKECEKYEVDPKRGIGNYELYHSDIANLNSKILVAGLSNQVISGNPNNANGILALKYGLYDVNSQTMDFEKQVACFDVYVQVPSERTSEPRTDQFDVDPSGNGKLCGVTEVWGTYGYMLNGEIETMYIIGNGNFHLKSTTPQNRADQPRQVERPFILSMDEVGNILNVRVFPNVKFKEHISREMIGDVIVNDNGVFVTGTVHLPSNGGYSCYLAKFSHDLSFSHYFKKYDINYVSGDPYSPYHYLIPTVILPDFNNPGTMIIGGVYSDAGSANGIMFLSVDQQTGGLLFDVNIEVGISDFLDNSLTLEDAVISGMETSNPVLLAVGGGMNSLNEDKALLFVMNANWDLVESYSLSSNNQNTERFTAIDIGSSFLLATSTGKIIKTQNLLDYPCFMREDFVVGSIGVEEGLDDESLLIQNDELNILTSIFPSQSELEGSCCYNIEDVSTEETYLCTDQVYYSFPVNTAVPNTQNIASINGNSHFILNNVLIKVGPDISFSEIQQAITQFSLQAPFILNIEEEHSNCKSTEVHEVVLVEYSVVLDSAPLDISLNPSPDQIPCNYCVSLPFTATFSSPPSGGLWYDNGVNNTNTNINLNSGITSVSSPVSQTIIYEWIDPSTGCFYYDSHCFNVNLNCPIEVGRFTFQKNVMVISKKELQDSIKTNWDFTLIDIHGRQFIIEEKAQISSLSNGIYAKVDKTAQRNQMSVSHLRVMIVD